MEVMIGSMKLNELTNLVTKLSERIRVLEDDLKKTKLTYSAVVTKLILSVKKLEAKVKAGTSREKSRVVHSEDDARYVTLTEVNQVKEAYCSRTVTYREGVKMDFNQHIEPVDLEHGSERMKSLEKIKEEDIDTQKEMKEVSKESGAKRKKSLPRKSTRSSVKRQKIELDDEKEDLKGYLDIVPREDVAEDVESLSTKYPIVDWKTYVLIENFMYYQIFKGDGSSKNYKVLSEMLEDFDRQDVMDLHRLVKERSNGVGEYSDNALAKLPMLKLGEYEMWEIRIKQYFQIQDYALWEVIENENSWVPIHLTIPSESGSSTTIKMTMPSTAEEKTCKRNDYVDAQSMFAAIKARFGGNEATKKTQKALLKQQYENFSASSSESLDSIFNMLQRLVSRLAILGVVTPPEDLNVKFLRSLPSEWDTHVVVWMNKPDFDTMCLDDLYNNFKIVEQKVKKSASASKDDKNLAFVTTSGASSTNNINTVNPEVSTATTKRMRAPRSKDNKIGNQGSSTKAVKIEDASEKAIFKAATYKRGLTTLEDQIIKYREHEVLFSGEIALLKRSVGHKEYQMGLLRDELEKVKQEKESSLKPTIACDKESDNSKENTDNSLEQHQIIDTESSSVKSSLKVEKKTVIPTATKKEFVKLKNQLKGQLGMFYLWKFDHHSNTAVLTIEEKDSMSDNILVGPFSTARSFNIVRPSYTAYPKSTIHCARPRTYFQNQAQSTVHNPFYKRTTLTKMCFNQRFNTGRPFRSTVNTVRARGFNAVKPSACWVWRPIKPNGASLVFNKYNYIDARGRSKHMTGNIGHLSDFKDFDGGYVTFGGGAYGGKITGKGTIKTDNLDFDDLPDENQILLKIPRQDNMYSFDMKNIVPKDSLTCLVAKATSEESMLWHRRLGHINFKNINKLVKENLVRDLPLKRFENDQTCVACLKGKQHRASCKTKAFNPITKPLFMLHMDLFGPTFVSSLMHKKYCLVVTDDYSRFSWVFFLTTKDETSEILKIFIKEVENLVDKKVKIIRSDNGTEFKNKVMDDFCREKGIKREYSVARTPQQNGVAERKNRTLIEAARIMLADSKLPITFWAEAVSTACYVQNRVLIVKPHNKTPYELFRGFKPAIGFMKPFGCHVTILNTLDNLGKFDGKSNEDNKPMIEGNGPKWLFYIDSLTQSMNYVPVVAGTFSNDFASIQGVSESSTSSQQDQENQDCIVMPIWKDASYFGDVAPRTIVDAQIEDKDGLQDENDAIEKSHDDSSLKDNGTADQQVNTARPELNTGSKDISTALPEDNTATPEDLVGPSPASEDTEVED
ncbi:putative ribonuclease H-like domain-containing protein [Tanacetum coccineum]